MSEVLFLDDSSSNLNNYLIDYLKLNFKTTVFDVKDNVEEKIKIYHPKVVISNSIFLNLKVDCPVILYLNNPESDFLIKRNLIVWRQIQSTIRSFTYIYAASNYMAKIVSNNLKVPCLIQHYHIPNQKVTVGTKIVSNDNDVTNNLKDVFPQETFATLNSLEDIKSAKLYIHSSRNNELCNYIIPYANSCFVPSLMDNKGCLRELSMGNFFVEDNSKTNLLIQNTKKALRDLSVNSEKLKEMRIKYSSVLNMQDKIQNILKGQLPPKKMQQKSSSRTPVRREPDKHKIRQAIVSKRTRNVTAVQTEPKQVADIVNRNYGDGFDDLRNFMNNDKKIYFGIGGLGDLLLILAKAFNDPKAGIIFKPNMQVKTLISDVVNAFNIPFMLINKIDSKISNLSVYHYIKSHPNFASQAHIPENIDYSKWDRDPDYYVSRTETNMFDWVDYFGKAPNLRNTSGVIGILPRGSTHSNFKQRYLEREEYVRLVRKFVSNKTVISIGSEEDLAYYGLYPSPNHIWVTSRFAHSYQIPKYEINARYMFALINSCEHVFSVDSWLKTYSGLVGIPTTVIMSRYDSESLFANDASDKIFLNKIWGFRISSIEELIKFN